MSLEREEGSLMRFAVVVACIAAINLCLADPASAGSYLMRSCNVPGERATPVGPWRWQTPPNTFADNECARGAGFGINAGPMNAGDAAGVVLETGNAIAIRRVRLWMVARLRSTGSAMFAAASSGNSTTATPADLFGPPGGETLNAPYVSPLLPPDTSIYIVFVSCSGNLGEGCSPLDTNILDVHGVEVTLEENAAPTGSIEGGELLASGTQSGLRSLAYKASDQQSGVMRVAAIIGKTVAGDADFAGTCDHAGLAACASARSGSLQVDTRKVPDGIYPVSLRVTDAAGNEHTVQAATAIQVDNPTVGPGIQGSTPTAAGGGLLHASFAANGKSRLTVGFRKRVVIRGTLTDSSGALIGGAPIEIEERPAYSNAKARTATVSTASDGTFSYTSSRAASSRSVTVRYVIDSANAVQRTLRLRVKASATLRVALRGIVVRYRGRVLSRPLRRAGTVVDIQGRAPGGTWKTFARRRANRRGNYEGTYRLRVHRPGVRLQFRVRVPKQDGYPFSGHAGRPLTRTVR